jgi:MscS family membrane protein
MIVMDRPYSVGERIRIKGYDGIVEEIGLRSTKIRLLNGNQAVIPNEEMARSDIENVGRRPFIRRVSNLRLPLDAGKDTAEEAVALIQGILEDHEGCRPDYPPRVWLHEFKSDHIELRMIYWYHPPDYWMFTAHADEINRRILNALEHRGIRLAVPAFSTRFDYGGEEKAELPPE